MYALIVDLVLLFFWPSFVIGQSSLEPVASGYFTSGSYSQRHLGPLSFTGNQASLAGVKNSMGSLYGERRFMLSQLGYYSASFLAPVHSGVFGALARYFGSPALNQTGLSLAYGRRLSNKLDVGVQFNYSALHAPGYGAASRMGVEAGMIVHISEKFHTGFHVANPQGQKAGDIKMPSVYSMGFGYDASGQFLFAMEFIKEEGNTININAGIAYKVVEKLELKMGMSSATASGYFGSGISWGLVRLDLLTHYHPQLGLTPALEVTITSPDHTKR